jgi:hypothetical protein
MQGMIDSAFRLGFSTLAIAPVMARWSGGSKEELRKLSVEINVVADILNFIQ